MNQLVKELREFRGEKTKVWAAKQIGIPVSTYRHYESGRKCDNPILILTTLKYLQYKEQLGLPDIVVE